MDHSNSQYRDAIAEWIHSERDRRILERRLIDGVTFERLAEEFDMSDRQVRRICRKLEEQLFKHL